MITGEYNVNGYTVSRDGQEIYSAGNSPLDSASHESNPRFAVPVQTLGRYCRQTIKDLAAESGDTWMIPDRIPNDD